MTVTVLPKTNLGKWSFGLILAFVLCIFIFLAMIFLLNQRGGETFFSNLFLTVPMLLAWGAASASFFTGIAAIFKSRDRSVLVMLAAVLGLLFFLYGVAQVIFPH